MLAIRPPAVAGLFYPAEPAQLAYDVQHLLNEATPHELPIKALIVPHAGYIYSGAIAATAYAALRPIAARIRRVVLLGPTHRVAVRGLALPDAEIFDTPLGRVMLDTQTMHAIAHLPQISISSEAHLQEHSLEVQLPFLQTVLSDFTLLPLAVGMASADEVAEVLEAVWGGEETLIVISSDLSHYLPYSTAQRVDRETADSILELHQPIAHDRACGGTPVSGLIVAARHHHLTPHLLDLRNSGDTAGSHDRVVGYAAFAFTGEQPVSNEKGKTLLRLARAAIAKELGFISQELPRTDWLEEPGATFVTLTLNDQLRGCIGSLEAYRPLIDDVRHNAAAAAFNDTRFDPLSKAEFDHVLVEVSLLSPPETIRFKNEQDALAQLHPGKDGVILEYVSHRATFLPQVWAQLQQPQVFLAHLKNKAGLAEDFWSDQIKLSRYTVKKWREGG